MPGDFGDSLDGRYSWDPRAAVAPSGPRGVPNRGTSEQSLDEFNRTMRTSELYLNFLRRNGLGTNGPVKLSRDQQAALERELAGAGQPVPSGMHIDQGGNLNQKNHLVRNSAITAGAIGAAATGFGLAGMGPLAGLGGPTAAGMASVPGAVGASAAPLGVGTVAGGAAGAGTAAATAAGYSSPGIFSGVSFGAPAAAGVASAAAAPAAATAGGSMGLGQWLPALIGAGAQGVSSVANSRAVRAARESDERLTRDKMALDESELDPFRALLAQIVDADKMDRLANYTPMDFTGNPYASYIPKTNFAPSNEMRSAAATGRSAVLSGQGQATPIANRAQPGATSGVMDLIANSRPPGRAPVSGPLPVGAPRSQPAPMGVLPDIDNYGAMTALDEFNPSYLGAVPPPGAPPRMRRPRPRARMAVAA